MKTWIECDDCGVVRVLKYDTTPVGKKKPCPVCKSNKGSIMDLKSSAYH